MYFLIVNMKLEAALTIDLDRPFPNIHYWNRAYIPKVLHGDYDWKIDIFYELIKHINHFRAVRLSFSLEDALVGDITL